MALVAACSRDATAPAGPSLDGDYTLAEWQYSYYGQSFPLEEGSRIDFKIAGDSVAGRADLVLLTPEPDTVLATDLKGTWYRLPDGRIAFDFLWDAGGATWFAALPWRELPTALLHDTRSASELLHIRLARR